MTIQKAKYLQKLLRCQAKLVWRDQVLIKGRGGWV